jgi:hypothetical protein
MTLFGGRSVTDEDIPEWRIPPKRPALATPRFFTVFTAEKAPSPKPPVHQPKVEKKLREEKRRLTPEQEQVLGALSMTDALPVVEVARKVDIPFERVRYWLYRLKRMKMVVEKKSTSSGGQTRLAYSLPAASIHVTKFDSTGRPVAHEYQNWEED